MNIKLRQAVIDRLVDKTLKFGCKALLKQGGNKIVIAGKGLASSYICLFMYQRWTGKRMFPLKDLEILGSPILLGDVIEKTLKMLKERSERKIDAEGVFGDLFYEEQFDKALNSWGELGASSSLQDLLEVEEAEPLFEALAKIFNIKTV